ncbi:MAG: ABC transporter permease subunit [Gallicola sp.]|nr:ABC transporter permease subunit [Gallicola sp.]
MKNKKIKTRIFMLPFLLLAILFIFVPLISIILQSFKETGGPFGLTNYINIFKDEYFRLGIQNSIVISIISTVIGIVLSFLCAYCIYRSTGKVRRAFVNLMNATSNFQGIQLAFAFMILLGTSGVLTLTAQNIGLESFSEFNLYSSTGLLLTYIYFQIPLGTLLMYPSFDAIKREYLEAAELMGVKGVKFWTRVGVPILAPSILGTFSILFANSIAAYATPYALLGNNYPLLPIQISSMFTGDIIQRVDIGSALSVIMMVLLLGVTFISNRLMNRRGAVHEKE